MENKEIGKKILRHLDEIKPSWLPLGDHFIKVEDEHTRLNYARFLATLLLVNGNPSERQSRLFNLLLDSMDMNGQLPAVLESATKFDQKSLDASLDLIAQSNLENCLLVDSMVLSRIDNQLSSEQIQILSEISEFLDISELRISVLTRCAADILGIQNAFIEDFSYCYEDITHWKNKIYLDGWRPIDGAQNRYKDHVLYDDVLDTETNLIWRKYCHGITCKDKAPTGKAVSISLKDFDLTLTELKISEIRSTEWAWPDIFSYLTLLHDPGGFTNGLQHNGSRYPHTGKSKFAPKIDQIAFPMTPKGKFASSSSGQYGSDYKQAVETENGLIYQNGEHSSHGGNYYFRAVRKMLIDKNSSK